MESLKNRRLKLSLSQRRLADLASISYKTLQLIESGTHDTKLSTLERIVHALGYPAEIIDNEIDRLLRMPLDSVRIISEKIIMDGSDSWKIHLFNFVDSFRKDADDSYVAEPPVDGIPEDIEAIIAGTVETLCDEMKMNVPQWCVTITSLKRPWFVAGIEYLKAISLVESPIHFRKRNIFVLSNFLDRR